MRRKLVYPILIAMVSSVLFLACDPADSVDSIYPPTGGESSEVSTTQVSFATKSVGSSISDISAGVFESLKVSEIVDDYGMTVPGFPGDALVENSVVYEGAGIEVTSEGFSADPAGLRLGVALDEYAPVDGVEGGLNGNFTVLVGMDKTMPFEPRILMVFNTEDGEPLTVNGGDLDGTTLEFDNLALYYSMSPVASEPAGVEGTLLVNGEPVDRDMLDDMLPELPELAEFPELSEVPGLSGEGVSSDTLKIFVEMLRSSLTAGEFADLLKDTLLDSDISEVMSLPLTKGLMTDALPFPIPEDLYNNKVIYEGDGITITFKEYSEDPAALLFEVALDEFVSMEGVETSISGNFMLLAGIDKSNIMAPRYMMNFNTEEDAPLTLNGGELDGTTLEFDDFTVFYNFSPLAAKAVETEGTVLINDKPVSREMLKKLLPVLPVLGSEGMSEEALQVVMVTLGSVGSVYSAGDVLDFFKDSEFSGNIFGGLTKSEGTKGLVDLPVPEGLVNDQVIYEGDGITVTLKEITKEPPAMLHEIVLDGYAPVEGRETSVTGTFTRLVGLDVSHLLDPKVKITFNSVEEAPLALTGGKADGTTVEFQEFTIYYSLSPVASQAVGVEGAILINGMPVPMENIEALMGQL